MNIIIIKIVFEQLPNFPFLRCVNRLPIGVDDLVNIGLNFFLPIRFFLPGLVLLAMSSKSSHFLCTEILEQDRDVGIRSTSLNLYFSQVIGIHIEKWEIKELAKMTTSPPIFGRYELFQIKYLETMFGQFHFLAYIWVELKPITAAVEYLHESVGFPAGLLKDVKK